MQEDVQQEFTAVHTRITDLAISHAKTDQKVDTVKEDTAAIKESISKVHTRFNGLAWKLALIFGVAAGINFAFQFGPKIFTKQMPDTPYSSPVRATAEPTRPSR